MSFKRPASLNSIQNESNPAESSQAAKKRKVDKSTFINPYAARRKTEAASSSTPPPNRTPLNSRMNDNPANVSIPSSSSTTSSLLPPLRTAEFSPVIPLRDEEDPFRSTIDPSLDALSTSDLHAILHPASSKPILPVFQIPLVETTPNVIRPIIHPPKPAQAPLPKAVTDKIVQLQDRISGLEGVAYDLRDRLEERDADIRDLDNENQQLWRRINELEEIHGDKLERIIDFIENNEFSGTGATHTSASKSGSKGKGERDNIFNTAMRKVFKAAMGHGVTVKLDILANDTPVKAGGSYITDSHGQGQLLRPDWSTSFNDNSRWHKSMLAFARKKAPIFHPTMTDSMIDAKTDDEIMERLENVFKNISDYYRRAKRNKATAQGGGDVGETQEAGEGEERAKQLNRRGTRKVRKCDERLAAYQEAHGDVPADRKWFFQAPYQSSDESDASDVVDPGTDVESGDEVPVSATMKPWLSPPPMYRDEKVTEWVSDLDDLVMAARAKHKKLHRNKTSGHPRKRGEWKDKGLPSLQTHQLKIPLDAVLPAWLEDHSEFDAPSCIHREEDTEMERND
ncbi:hypothetical protein K438DRAFT_1963683 [Mycena galopus ATCC 62051]|nr:hypothetical protein K438DRAFT_1963683 [Mycena galopus ATCC 62051]